MVTWPWTKNIELLHSRRRTKSELQHTCRGDTYSRYVAFLHFANFPGRDKQLRRRVGARNILGETRGTDKIPIILHPLSETDQIKNMKPSRRPNFA